MILAKFITHDTAEIQLEIVSARQFKAMVVAHGFGLLTILSGMEVKL